MINPTSIPCPNCGKQIDARARYCRHCGHSLMAKAKTDTATESETGLRIDLGTREGQVPATVPQPRLRTGQTSPLMRLIPILAIVMTLLVILSVILFFVMTR
jgi:uncharacterized membrane protein YvbJ